MKKLLSILAVFGVSAVGTTSVVACNKTESNNLSIVKTIAAPATVATADPKKVTNAEIKTALEANVLKAVQGVVETATAADFQFDVYQDNKGTSLTTINLEGGNVEVYVQITPAKDKTVVIGKTGYIKVTLPKIKVDISSVVIDQQIVEIKAADPKKVTNAEIKTALEANVLKAVQGVVETATAADFQFDVYQDNKGTSLTTINLEGGNVEVYVQITPAKDKTVVIGKTGYIKVTLPKIKVDISSVVIDQQIVEIKAADPKKVTKDELNAVNTYATLASAVLEAIKNKAPNAGASDFEITNNCDAGDYSTEKDVKVTVKAKDESPNISGEFKVNAKVKATLAPANAG
uniref:Spiralin n=1 Tax=Spiroplasma citri TaxID=2133 RepID=I1U7D6_SPICI|nr:spiralin [Spiroplasma citri]